MKQMVVLIELGRDDTTLDIDVRDIRELQQVIINMCHERYSHYRPD